MTGTTTKPKFNCGTVLSTPGALEAVPVMTSSPFG